jgi:predicted PurR-regulated permease PerM
MRLVVFAFTIALLLAVGWVTRHALLLIYVSAVFAVVFTPAVDGLHKRGIFRWHPSRGAALLLLIGALVLALGLLLTFALPPLVSDIKDFVVRLPELLGSLRDRLQSVPFLKNIDLQRLPALAASSGGSIAIGFGNLVMDVLTILLLIAYFILDGERLLRSLLSTVPAAPRRRLAATLNRAGCRMRGWLTGQLLLMLILGSASLVTFGLMRLPYFYLLGVFGGIANIIPLLGPLATVILAAAIAATQSMWKVVGVLIFYAVYQQVENAFLTPRIMKAQVELSSAVVIIALLIGGEIAGIAGALVAVPSAVLVVELASEYLVRDSTTRRDSTA